MLLHVPPETPDQRGAVVDLDLMLKRLVGSSSTTTARTRSRSPVGTPPSGRSWQRHPGRALLRLRLRYGVGRLLRPETGNPRDHMAFVLKSARRSLRPQGRRRPRSPLLDHHRKHGDGIVDIVLEVPDVDKLHRARALGRRDRPSSRNVSDEHGTVRNGRHRDVRRHPAQPSRRPQRVRRPHLPGYCRADLVVPAPEGSPQRLFQALDPSSVTSSWGRMDEWVEFTARSTSSRTWCRVHRRRHRHRLAHVEGRRERQPPGEVPASTRTGDREEASQIDEYLEF